MENVQSLQRVKKKNFKPKFRYLQQGTEAEVYVKKAIKTKTKAPEKSVKKGDWRKKHEEFIQAIRAGNEFPHIYLEQSLPLY